MVLKGRSFHFVTRKNTDDHKALNSRDRGRAVLKSAHNEIHSVVAFFFSYRSVHGARRKMTLAGAFFKPVYLASVTTNTF